MNHSFHSPFKVPNLYHTLTYGYPKASAYSPFRGLSAIPLSIFTVSWRLQRAPISWELLFFLHSHSQFHKILWSSGLIYPIQAAFDSFPDVFLETLPRFVPAAVDSFPDVFQETLARFVVTLVSRPLLTRNHLSKFASTP